MTTSTSTSSRKKAPTSANARASVRGTAFQVSASLFHRYAMDAGRYPDDKPRGKRETTSLVEQMVSPSR